MITTATLFAVACTCISTCLSLLISNFTTEEINIIFELHTDARSHVDPPATNMLELMWTETLTEQVAGYIKTCPNTPPPKWKNKYRTLGYIADNFTYEEDVEYLMLRWLNESKSYDMRSLNCFSDQCDHYTQMVWAMSSEFGCARKYCRRGNNTVAMIACFYSAPGNIKGIPAYEIGESCSNCPSAQYVCHEKVCKIGASTSVSQAAHNTIYVISSNQINILIFLVFFIKLMMQLH